MTTEVYFIGGERDTCGSTTNCVEQSGSADTAYVRGSLGFNSSSANADYWSCKLIDPSTGAYTTISGFLSFRGDFLPPNVSSTTDSVVLEGVNGSGTVVFRVLRSTATCRMQFWNGATYTDVGATWTWSNAQRKALVIDLTPGASGSVKAYIDGDQVASGSINDADCDAVAEWRLKMGNATNFGNAAWSQIGCANVSLVGGHAWQRQPTGNGANTAWTGAFGDVDELVSSDADFNTSSSAGDKETDTHAAITLGGAVQVLACAIGMRAKNSAGGPQNAKTMFRIGGADYVQSYNVAGVGSGFAPAYGIWMQDPSTSANWGSNATSASTEAGYQSAA